MSTEAELREVVDLRSMVDERIELALVKRWTIRELLEELMPVVGAKLGAESIHIETYVEDLTLRRFDWARSGSAALPRETEVVAKTSEEAREHVSIVDGASRVVAQHLDVAGSWFGRAAVVVPKESNPGRIASSLNAVCEVLDNHLFSIRAAREKHNVMMRLGNALRHRVLSEGLGEAVRILAEAIPIERIALVYVAEESAARTLHVQMFEGATLRVDTMAVQGDANDPIRALGRSYLAGENRELLAHLGVEDAQEEVLINGITKSVVVGKIVVTTKASAFNTYDRELLSAFAGYIRQRIVDFNKEWRALATTFRPDDVGRLLQHDDYERRFLAPREERVAILYVDISGFTRLSETVLKTPAKVAELVEVWSRDAVDIVWEHGGVFDKMVGDCIIALFGPPFYEESPAERLARAIRCAVAIRTMTNEMPERTGLENLRPHGVSVSTGVNLAPLFVGQFGPNGNFTGFSSGMNNTARLQGCATKDEILVMEDAIAELDGQAFTFGEPRSMAVKNVADPLRFRALR